MSSSENSTILRPRDFFRSLLDVQNPAIFRDRGFFGVSSSENPAIFRDHGIFGVTSSENLAIFGVTSSEYPVFFLTAGFFWSAVVQKSRNYLKTQLMNSEYVIFQSTVITLKDNYSMMNNKYIFHYILHLALY